MSRRPLPARILYCESNSDGTIGGSHYCLLNLVENLDRLQFEPVALFLEDHALVPRFRAAGQTLVADAGIHGVRWGTSPRAMEWPRLSAPLRVARKTVNAILAVLVVAVHVRFLRRQRIRLVHLNNSISRHHAMMAAAFLCGVPCISHERGIPPRYSWVDRFLARRLALIIPVARWMQEHMVANGVSPANMRVMYDGLDPDSLTVSRSADVLREEWKVRADQPVVGIVGNIRAWKGQETVVKALIEVVRVHPDLVCFFIGAATPADRPFEDRLRGMIADAGIESNVRFTGYQKDVASFVNMMRFVIHASVRPEPFGLVVLEAMAQQKAVIGSRAGGIIEMVVEGETGYTFPSGDNTALATRILELLDYPERADEMGRAGYRRVTTHFTLQAYMKDIQAAYAAILDRRRIPAGVGIRVQGSQG